MVDGKPRIGDEVYIHGYIDEIRNDVIIIRNVGGYFGTSRDEVFYYEEDERGYGTMNEADRKTEPQKKEVEWVYNKRERLWYPYSNGELLFNDKPTTQTKTQNSNLTFEKRTMRDCYNCKRNETEGACVECHYEPKDEPQTDCPWK